MPGLVRTPLTPARSLNSVKLRRIEGNNFLHSWQGPIEREKWQPPSPSTRDMQRTPGSRTVRTQKRNTHEGEGWDPRAEGVSERKELVLEALRSSPERFSDWNWRFKLKLTARISRRWMRMTAAFHAFKSRETCADTGGTSFNANSSGQRVSTEDKNSGRDNVNNLPGIAGEPHSSVASVSTTYRLIQALTIPADRRSI